MTHPQHPCPPNNPHCGGTVQPPTPGNNTTATVSIDMYIPFFLLCVAGFLIGFVVGTTNKK